MFDKADILKRLQNGETAEDIAKEMSDALNEAMSEQKAEEAKRLEEEKALEAKRAEEDRIYASKREAVCEIIDGFCDFAVANGDDEFLAELQNVDPDKMVRMLDEMIELAKSFDRLKHLEFPRVEKNDDTWIKLFAEMF